MHASERKLFAPCTYAATERLKALREGREFLTMEDLKELFEEFCDGQEGWGDGTRNVTLAEFGSWLAGNQFQEGHWTEAPAEIVW